MRGHRHPTRRSSRSGHSDEELLDAARTGDSDAYFKVWSRHANYAQVVARRLTRSEYDAEDLVSCVSERIWTALSNGNGPQLAFRSYLSAALRNTAAQNARRNPSTVALDALGDLATPAETGIDQVVDSAVMRTALLSLNERQREAVVLSEMCGASNADMAQHFGTTKNNASQIARRAVASLRYAYIDAHMNIETDAEPECLDCMSTIRRVVAGDAAPQEAGFVDDHIDMCESCAAAYAAATDATRHRALIAPLMLGGGATAEWMATPSRGAFVPRGDRATGAGARSVPATATAAGSVVLAFGVLVGGSDMVDANTADPSAAGEMAAAWSVPLADQIDDAFSGFGHYIPPEWLRPESGPVGHGVSGNADRVESDATETETQPHPPAPAPAPAPGATKTPDFAVSREDPPPVAPSADQEPEPALGQEDPPGTTDPSETENPEPSDDDTHPEPAPEPPVEYEPEPEDPITVEPGEAGSFARIETFSGRWDIVTATGMYAPDETACDPITDGSTTLTITYPVDTPDQTRNLITWSGSGTPDTEIVVNGQPVTATNVDETGTYTLPGFDTDYWQATAEIPAAADGIYEISGLSTTMTPSQCASTAVVANVTLTSLYEHESNPDRIFTMATGLVPLHTDIASPAWVVPSPTGKVVEIYAEVLEGDSFGEGETVSIGHTRIDDGSGVWDTNPGDHAAIRRWTIDPHDPEPVTLTSGNDHVLVTTIIVVSEL